MLHASTESQYHWYRESDPVDIGEERDTEVSLFCDMNEGHPFKISQRDEKSNKAISVNIVFTE